MRRKGPGDRPVHSEDGAHPSAHCCSARLHHQLLLMTHQQTHNNLSSGKSVNKFHLKILLYFWIGTTLLQLLQNQLKPSCYPTARLYKAVMDEMQHLSLPKINKQLSKPFFLHKCRWLRSAWLLSAS